MSLAEELLADLEAQDDDEEEHFDMQLKDGVIEEVADEEMLESYSYDRVGSVARLRDSDKFKTLLQKISDCFLKPFDKAVCGPVECDPEYKLVVDANNLAAEIDNEINVIHKFVRDKYAKRFPELESLVPMPMEYISCVMELGNEILEKARNSETLQTILLPATVIVVSVTASTTQGSLLSDDELLVVNEACLMGLQLNAAKAKIYEFVESRMNFIAPNLSIVIGSATAAKVMGVAGGLTQLSKMPACNILVLGAQKKTLTGFSSIAIMPHTGYLYYTPLVQSLPPDLRRKGADLVACKCALAARVDAVHSAADGSIGRKLITEITSKLEKWQEPPPVKQVKALPKPLDVASKKRGGRRVRKLKERLGMTDVRKKANRVTFGELSEDVLQDSMGFSVGQLKTSSGGRIRAPQVDEKTRVRPSKSMQKNLQKQQQSFGGASSVARKQQVAGTASSVTFTPVQGLEIVNPLAADKFVELAKTKYFTNAAGFTKMQPPK